MPQVTQSISLEVSQIFVKVGEAELIETAWTTEKPIIDYDGSPYDLEVEESIHDYW